ncbi:right-handed parallel beta-helix repeat-containing protein [Anaerotruncus massiliensis (ex Liu et al. 2021)]|uniref:right-handed parallel beta-helix repeat-containing protein n=1 Tax=Anaerotruncus massiliensis (ex Liu et al. 2021) TaxID=2321404 RepID=UPI003AF456E5
MTVKSGEENGHEENAPSEVTEASTAVPASADGVYTVKAFRGENLLTTMSLAAPEIELHSRDVVYWNPDPETKSNADGTATIWGGSDDNRGDENAPVRSFEQALELAAPGGTIYCMNPAAESADYLKRNSQMSPGDLAFSGVFAGLAQTPVRVARHENHPSGAIFTLGEGVAMTLSEIEISGADVQTDELIRLAGGILKIGTGLRLSGGQILFEHPDTAQAVELLALPEDTLVLSFAAGENGFKASFDAARAAEGVSMRDALAKLALTQSLQAATPAWSLTVRADDASVVQARPAVVYNGAVYLSGAGDDVNTGAAENDPVRTFARAKELLLNELSGQGEIRICGTVPVEGDETWSGATVSRSGSGNNKLIDVTGSLTLDGITLHGGRPGDSGNISVSGGTLTVTGGSAFSGSKGGSSGSAFEAPMIRVSAGSLVLRDGTVSGTDVGAEIVRGGRFTMENGTVSNVLRGVEVGEDSAFQMDGGSISATQTGVVTKGEFVLSAGSVAAPDGGFAVSVDRSTSATKAAFLLNGPAAALTGKIRLESPEETITLTGAPGAGKVFAVELSGSHRPGNIIVQSGGTLASAADYADAFTLSGTAYPLAGYQNNLVLMGGVYLDGTAAADGSGASPDSPVRTFEKAMAILSKSGGAIPAKIILCGPVTVSGTETWSSPLDETVEVTRWDDSALTLNQFVTVADGGSLTLENVVLDGLYGEAETSVNTIVSVAAGGSLTLADGAAVRGSAGSGVSVAGGSVTLAGGEISGSKGRGINATGASTVKVVSGRITGNGRNGVYLDGGSMTMSGGEISGNYAVVEGTERYAVHRGGGVWIAGGGFTMSGGKISGNLCDDILDRGGEALGGGVYFAGDRMFMNGSAEISGNTATKGGGVYLAGTSSMEMGGNASISGNHVHEAYPEEESRHEDGSLGGGVYVAGGDFVMSDSASITNNEAKSVRGRRTSTGGGVYIAPGLAMLQIEESVTVSGNTAQRGAGVAHEGAYFNLGGTGVTIPDEIFIDMEQNSEVKKSPISLLAPLDTSKKFQLRVPDTYIGKTVVAGAAGYNAASYLEQGVFTLVDMGGGLTLAGEGNNIVGRGGLYVYLSGSGNDGNNGTSPDDAVRTFARAKELLKSRSAGTNILISATVVVREDETWSLPEMTDNAGETWRPEIRTMADGSYTFAPIFISREGAGSVVEYPDAKLTLKDVVVNGNGTPIVSGTTQSRYGTGLIQVSGGAALVLGEGTVIENGTGPGVVPTRGTCTIDGAIIRNNAGPGLHTPSDHMTITMNSGSVTGNQMGGVIIEGNTHKFILNGGTISDNTHGESGLTGDSVSGLGGGVCIRATGSSFEMSGGTISGNTASGSGGGVYLSATSGSIPSCVITGGKITGNQAGADGGGVYSGTNNSRSTVVVSGDTEISGNTAGRYGGGVYGELTLESGAINSNAAKTGGGGVDGNVTMRNGSISDNTAEAGGGINAFGNITALYGGEISGNTALFGGGILVRGGTVLVDGGSITGNHATGTDYVVKTGGGAIGTGMTSSITIRSGTISGNTSATNGGAIMMGMVGRSFTVEGGVISGNEAAWDGGGIYLFSCTNFTMSGGSVSGNRAGGSGGGIGINDSTTKQVYSGGSITGNTAAANGGGIDLVGNATFNGVTVSDNTALAGGGVRVSGEKSTLTINAGGVTGNRTTAAGVTGGAGVYVDGGTVTAAGGQISGNALGNSTQHGGSVYVADGSFVLNGGRTAIDGTIHLNTTASPVRVSAAITQNRKYRLTMNMGGGDTQYQSGSAVVSPLSGSAVSDASAYLRYFQADTEALLLDKASPNIVLRKIVFLDGENGGTSEWYDGSTPARAFKTFESAKAALAGEPGAIYVTGTVTVTEPGTGWTLADGQYLRRYSGFEVSGQKTYDAFAGDLVRVADGGTLTLGGISIEGRRSAEDSYTAAGTLVRVARGGSLTMGENTVLCNNKTSGDGGAVVVEPDGIFAFNGGAISNTQAARGDAVHQNGTMSVNGNPTAEGSVYLAAGRTVDAVTGFAGTLTVDVADPYAGREVVAYQGVLVSPAPELAKFTLAEAVAAQYRLVHGTVGSGPDGGHSVLKLGEKGFVYVDGSLSADAGDGATPDGAFATLNKAYSSLKADGGGTIYIVNPVKITGSVKINSDSYIFNVTGAGAVTIKGGPVAIKRYSKPVSPLPGYGKASNTAELFIVENGGTLQVAGTTLDGHSEAVTQGAEALAAPAVEAQAPLVTVRSGGSFHTDDGAVLRNNRNASADGQGGAVYIAEGGTYKLYGGSTIANTHAEEGSAVYQAGQLMISSAAGTDEDLSVEGEVFLGTEKYIETFNAFAPRGALKIDLADAYKGRTIITYDAQNPDTIVVDPSKAALSGRVSAGFTAGKREGGNVLELQAKGAVYIDGINGSDDRDGGSPAQAVKTLAKAYEKLAAQKGGTLYVVGEVAIPEGQNITLSGQELYGMGYVDAGGPVTIMRYSQPEAHESLGDNYAVASNSGSIFTVDGGSLTLEEITVDGHRHGVTGAAEIASPGIGGEAAITVNKGSLILNEGAVLQNNASKLPGGAIATPLSAMDKSIEIEINGGKITGNLGMSGTDTNSVGAIFVGQGASLKMTDGEISGNEGGEAQYMIGGIATFGGQVEITGGSIRENRGMGLWLRLGNASLKNCLIADNTGAQYAGGVGIAGSTVVAENLTLSGNTVTGGSGGNGIYQNGTLRLRGRATSFGADQYVYLPKGKVINVDGALPDSAAIPVDMDRADVDTDYGPGRNVAVYLNGVVEDVADETAKFLLAESIDYTLAKSTTEANTLELGEPFHFMDLERDFLKQAGVPATIMAEVSSDDVVSCELYRGTNKIDTSFGGVVNSGNGGKASVSVTFTPNWGDDGVYHLEATDANGTVAKSGSFSLSLWKVQYSTGDRTAVQTSTLGADDSGPNDTASIVIAIQQPLAGGTSTSLSVGIGSYTMESADADYAPQLVSKETVTAGRTEWGRNDAMNKFAWTRPYEGTEYPVSQTRGWNQTVTLPFNFYNANAISESRDGWLSMKISLLERGAANAYADDMARIPFHTNPVSIDATVPLWVCMYGYGGDGKVVTPEEGSYVIKNNSLFPVQVTGMSVRPMENWSFVQPPAGGFLTNGSYDVSRNNLSAGQAALRLDTQWVSADAGAGWTAAEKTGPLFKPIGAAAERAVPVECYIPAGGVTADGETQIAAVTYTVDISGAAGDGG